jgi:Peptidase family S41
VRRIAFIFAVGSSLLAADTLAPVDRLSQAGVQTAFQVLRRDYIRREDLTFDQLNRAALQGLVDRLEFGAEIIPDKPVQAPVGGVVDELLHDAVCYLRPLNLSESESVVIGERLQHYAKAKCKHCILDLRAVMAPGDLNDAGGVIDHFVPEGTVLMKLKQLAGDDVQVATSKSGPAWTGTVIVLVDRETNNVGEVIAAVLRDQKRALTVGQTTRGATVHYQTVPLDAGWRLRFAHAEMLLPDDSSIFRRGVKADFTVSLEPGVKHHIFFTAGRNSMKPFIFEVTRRYFNEAALVARKLPELDDYIRRSSGLAMVNDSHGPRDAVLQRALDVLMSHDHFGQGRIDWDQPPLTFGSP